MKIFIKLLLTAFAVLVLSNVLSGVTVESYVTAIIVAFTIAVLNMFVRPILVILTLPVTIITLGLFLFVINALIVLFADKLVGGFYVNGFFTAMLFSILLTIFRTFLFSFLKEDRKKNA